MILKSDVETTAVCRLPIPVSQGEVEIDEIYVNDKTEFGFLPREEKSQTLSAKIGDIFGSPDSTLLIEKYVTFYYATRSEITKKLLTMTTSIYLKEFGRLEMPDSVIVQRENVLEICGSLQNVKNLTVQDNGYIKMAFPGSTEYAQPPDLSTLEIDILSIGYQGSFEKSSKCSNPSNLKTYLQLKFFRKTSDFHLDTSKFRLTAANSVELSPQDNVTCTGPNMHIYRNKVCRLYPGIYNFESVIIESGAKLELVGDPTGVNETTLNAKSMEIMYGGEIEGTGTGYQSEGPGSASSNSVGGTHGGSGGSNPVDPYGSVIMPRTYGSNGFGATSSSKRGGGQVEVQVTGNFILNGDIKMNGEEEASGGSALIVAETFEGNGVVSVKGGTNGGGGRIAVYVYETYRFVGSMTAAPGSTSASSGKTFLHLQNIV